MRNKTMLSRVVSFLLVGVMALSMLPATAFAASEANQNGEGSHQEQVDKEATRKGWSYYPDYVGMRLSLYWSPTKDGFDTTNNPDVIQVGKTIDVNQTGFGKYTPSFDSKLSVYERMKNGASLMETASFVEREYEVYTASDYSIISKMPVLTSRAYTEEELDEFFMGADPENPTYENTVQIVKMITGDAVTITGEDFDQGRFVDSYGQVKYGVFKLFYEPIYYFKVDSVCIAMTLRDAIAYSNVKTGFVAYFFKAFNYLANSVYLVDDEPAIGMKANTTGKTYGSTGASTETKEGITPGNAMYDSMGCGVVTGGLRAIPGPDILKTYITIESVDSNGVVHYKKAAETTLEQAEFNVDADGNITQIPVFENVEGAEGGVAILNDVVSISDDMVLEDKSEWVNTELPVNIGVDLKPTSEDIAGYLTGIVTGSELFIDTYKEAVIVDEPFLAALRAVQEVYRVLESQNAGSASEQVSLVPSFIKTRAHIGSESVLVKVVDAVPYVYFEDVKLGKIVDGRVEKIVDETAENTGGIGVVTPANNLILRYILKPAPSQVNVIEVVDEGKGTTSYINGGKQDLDITGSTVTVQKPDLSGLNDIGEPELIEWVTNSEYPLLDISNGTLPNMSDNGKKGSEEAISNYPQDPVIHNLYVKWKIVIPAEERTPGKYHVPEWRLSRLFDENDIPNGPAIMSLPVTYGHCGLARLSPSGNWNYTTRNPNGQVTLPNHVASNLKYQSWLHSETVHTGSTAYIGAYNPTAIVNIDGRMTGIKSTDTSGLKVVSWLDKGSINGLTAYDIQSSTKGTPFNKENYQLNALLAFNTLNLNSYTNTWPSAHYHKKGGHCHRWINSKTISPLGAAYVPYLFDAEIDFDRYLASQSSKLVVEPEIKVENGKTTIAYQADTELKVYPEIAMLFDNDAGDSSIKWAVGDQVRTISPVMFHTLQFKVFVTEESNASSYATDTRAITQARALGYAGKQVAYKGTSINTNFEVSRAEDALKTMGLLTVKTFALDISENKNGVNLKSSWGATTYKPKDIHNKFLSLWNGFKGTSTERLEVAVAGISAYYKGAEKNKAFSLSQIKYGSDSSPVVEFTHELIIRGGSVIGVRVQDRNTKAYTTVKISELEAVDAGLYEALENMKLIGENRNETVLKVFEHQTGAKVTEEKYMTMATQAKKSLDGGLVTENLAMNKGWYSEDCTTLVVKEYVTNYEVPSVSYSDKLSMTIKGLETPVNKAQYFSKMGTGHTFLNYTIKSANLKALDGDLSEEIKVFFEHNSRTGSPFGKKNVDYLVPNVSITDTIRSN